MGVSIGLSEASADPVQYNRVRIVDLIHVKGVYGSNASFAGEVRADRISRWNYVETTHCLPYLGRMIFVLRLVMHAGNTHERVVAVPSGVAFKPCFRFWRPPSNNRRLK
jgi:hypothetical protein